MVLPVLGMLLLAGCGSRGGFTIRKIEPAASFSLLDKSVPEQIVSYMWDFVVTDSMIIIADYRENDLVCFRKDGEFVRRIGREGQGPGEFKETHQLFAFKDYIAVDELGNRRLQVMTMTGELVKIFHYGNHVLNAGVKRQNSAFDGEGNYYLATNACESEKMIKKFDKDFNLLTEFGELEYGETTKFNPYDEIALVKKRQLNPTTKNNVLLVVSENKFLYVIHLALPLVKKYDLNGKLIFEKELNLEDLASYRRDHFIEAENVAKDFVFKNFWYWHDAAADSHGGVYLLFGDLKRMIIYHLSKNGDISEKYFGPEEKIRRIDYQDGVLWAFETEGQRFYQFRIGD